MTVIQGGTYTDPGYSATDGNGSDITDLVIVTGTVDTNTAGSYTINYNVTDSQGLTDSTTRTVVVVTDTEAPYNANHSTNTITSTSISTLATGVDTVGIETIHFYKDGVYQGQDNTIGGITRINTTR